MIKPNVQHRTAITAQKDIHQGKVACCIRKFCEHVPDSIAHRVEVVGCCTHESSPLFLLHIFLCKERMQTIHSIRHPLKYDTRADLPTVSRRSSTYVVEYLPGHNAKHGCHSAPLPGHSSPSYLGRGLLHSRVRFLPPLSQLVEQWLHSDQGAQLPFTVL